jgi:hypothetical protein
MTKLHELLAAEKTPLAAWHSVFEETLKKFGAESHYFSGYSKTLNMIEESAGNAATEAQAREEKPVTTTVYETLEYALDLYARVEDLQFQKNATNRLATGTVLFRGTPILTDLPVDELLGLESRLTKIRQLIAAVPTLDASKHWGMSVTAGPHVWVTRHPEETVKTEKQVIPVILHAATKEHPAQVQPIQKDVVVGKFVTIKRSGAATSLQKAEALKRIDELMVEIKQARMRANETIVFSETIAETLVPLLLEPFMSTSEDP